MKKQTKVLATLSAAALLAMGFSAVSFAQGWDNSTGAWQYLDKDGEPVTGEWKQSNGQYFYLGDDGNMVVDSLIEDDSNSTTAYYYVDANGARVTNTWKAVAMDDDSNTDLDAEYWWYYFGSDGKAYTTDAEDELSKGKLKTINGLKYAFDDEGHMLYGWIDKSNKDQQDDSETAWETSDYYFNGWNDGHAQNGWIQLTVDDDGDDKDYWFYFKDGKKKKGKQKINGKTYALDEEDGHMLDEWAAISSKGTVSSVGDRDATEDIVYVNGDGSQRKNKWVYAIPDEDLDADDYNDDEYSWWYFNKSGKLITDQIKKINGKWYAFDDEGRMKTDFVVGTEDNDYVDSFDVDKYNRTEFLNGTVHKALKGNKLYFFSTDEEKDGSRKTGYQNLELEDDTYQFYFNTSKGYAENGYVSKIKKYVSDGLVLKPADEDGTNYVGVYNPTTDTIGVVTDDQTVGFVLVNNSGSVVKNKAKLKDENDAYYVVDEDGVVLAYFVDSDAYDKVFDADDTLYTSEGKKITGSVLIDAKADGNADIEVYTKNKKGELVDTNKKISSYIKYFNK